MSMRMEVMLGMQVLMGWFVMQRGEKTLATKIIYKSSAVITLQNLKWFAFFKRIFKLSYNL